jgi:hypothetical protein
MQITLVLLMRKATNAFLQRGLNLRLLYEEGKWITGAVEERAENPNKTWCCRITALKFGSVAIRT